MTYVMSDLHGCYDKYARMLEKIGFGGDDTLYILGDVIDRGPDGIRILLDMMGRQNVIPLIGNHESLALSSLKLIRDDMAYEHTKAHILWTLSGGEPTQRAFLDLERDEQAALIDYIESFSIYRELDVNGRSFHLSHTLPGYDPALPIHEVSYLEFIWGEPDYETEYAPGVFFVTGHTPTNLIDPTCKWRIWQGRGHIAVDCAAAWGGRLGCLCLETMEEYYV